MNLVDSPKTIRQGEEIDVRAVETYLKDTIAGLDGNVSVKQFPSGFSNLTYFITVGDRELVLRRPPFGKKARTAHDMSREYHILKALHPVFPYCPQPLAFCDDHSVMGCDFYVMTAIRGIILRKDFPGTLDLSPAETHQLCQNMIDVFCQLHAVDYKAIGLENFGKPAGYVKRQVEGWSRRYRDARTDDAPDFEAVMTWLHDHRPDDTAEPALIHNDFKFDNLVLNPDNPLEIIGVLDWEMATLGDPLMDLGASLGYWVQADDTEAEKMIRMLPTIRAGMMTRREVVSDYLQKSGRPADHMNFYYVFGSFRLAVIAQQIYYRFYHGQTKDERFGLLIEAVRVLETVAQRNLAQPEF